MRSTRCALWAMPLLYALTAGPSWPLVIYRIGGGKRERPPEADSAGVEFVQLGWQQVDPAAGGEALDVELTAAGMRARRRDPQVNIAPGAAGRGGAIAQPDVYGQVFDGDTSTTWIAQPYLCSEIRGGSATCGDAFGSTGTTNIVLGGMFEIHRIRVSSGLRDASRTVTDVRVFLSHQVPPSYRPHWGVAALTPWLVEVRNNHESVLDIPIPPHEEVEFVQVAFGEHTSPWEVHEVEIYAKGYVQQATYVSSILDLGRPMTWGEVRWSGSKGDKAKVQVQTRSGMDDDPVLFWRFTGRGEEKEEVSRQAYPGLGVGERGGSSYDRDHWSYWAAYEFGDSSGTQVVSPAPRRYFQLKVDILPRDEDGGQVEFLEFRASEPVAAALVGEVWPVEAQAGVSTPFTYLLRPTIGARDRGFDRVELRSPSLLGPVSRVRIGDEEVPHTLVAAEPHRVVIGLPRLGVAESGALVEVDFHAQVLRYGARFDARVWDSTRPLEVPQEVGAGDATGEYEGNRVSVATSQAGSALLRVRVSPGVVTPNGDGTNDRARISYEILDITGRARVQIEVCDLSGRRVRALHSASQGVGQYEQYWDGRDAVGSPVPPGIYLCRITTSTDKVRVEQTRLLHAVR
ncbi:MAG: FlgD immunoglobulin-like domain containing protein [Candidatus Latescibacterota bacterium]